MQLSMISSKLFLVVINNLYFIHLLIPPQTFIENLPILGTILAQGMEW